MTSTLTANVFALLIFSLAPTPLVAQSEFSADMVNIQSGSQQNAKLFVDKNKMRIESEQPGGQSAPLILDFTSRITRMLISDRKIYVEMPQGQGMQRGYAFFRPADADDACDSWLKLASRSGGSCRKLGSVTVNGRNAVGYEGKTVDGDISHVWLDPKLAFPLKWDSKNGGGELRNIQEAPQPSSLFEIPADFQEVDLSKTMHHPPHPQPK